MPKSIDSLIYLDHAAATPLDADVFAAMSPYFGTQFYNPSALYWPARQVAKDVQAARQSLAQVLGCRPTELIFTAGGTESDNLAVHGTMAQYADAHMVTSAIEHDAVLHPAQRYNVTIIAPKPDGIIDAHAMTQAITDKTVLVSLQLANNELGTVQPVRELSRLVQDIRRERRAAGNRRPLYVHTDACQAGNYLDLHVDRLGIDLMTINGGKVYGPKQSGALYIKAGTTIEAMIDGGGQERGLRSGTENVPAIIGLAAAFQKVQSDRTAETKRLSDLRKRFIAGLPGGSVVNGSLKRRLPNNVHITFPGIDNERLLVQLDEAGVLAAAGSACSASNDEPSHVLKAIGLTDVEARSSLRFTMGRSTTADQIDYVLNTLKKLV